MNIHALQWDQIGVAAAVGGTVGLWLGYQARKIYVGYLLWREDSYRKAADKYHKLKEEAKATGQPIITAQQKRSMVIPIERAPKVSHWSDAPGQDRADVIAALNDAGYSKAASVKAADACSLAERAAGMEHWIVAALRHAAGGGK